MTSESIHSRSIREGSTRERFPRDEDLGRVVAEILPEVAGVYLFGSRAADAAIRSSDVDVAVLAAGPIALEQLVEAREALAERLRCDVDLIDLAGSSTVLQAQVVSTGRLVRDTDPLLRECFEMRAYSAYARLNEERREILERIQREGRVRGG